jgi:two-component system OmpR family sensor kinase
VAQHSIALRLAIGLTVGTALLWIGAASIAGTVMQRQLDAAFDETLKQSAFRLLPLVTHGLREPREGNDLEIAGLAGDEGDFSYYVRDRAGAMVVRSAGLSNDVASIPAGDGFSEVEGKRLFAITDQRFGYGIVVIERTDHRRAALVRSLAALTWPLLALIPLIALGIWFAIRLAMRPLERLRRDIASRDSRNLSPLISEGHPTELAPIAEAVASLLTRLRAAMDAERSFAASSAHELRTPIAGALAQTQQLAIELGNRPGSVRLKEIEHALRHLAHLAEMLLQLSRLDAGFAQSDVDTDLLPVLRLVVRDFHAMAGTGSRVHLRVEEGATLIGAINMDAFAIAVRNLIQNALIHGTADGSVEVTARRDNAISVVNAGPIVPADVLARIGERFVRGATSASGTGLGLSIVGAIMEQTGGGLALYSPATGAADGFEAVLMLPAHQVPAIASAPQ